MRWIGVKCWDGLGLLWDRPIINKYNFSRYSVECILTSRSIVETFWRYLIIHFQRKFYRNFAYFWPKVPENKVKEFFFSNLEVFTVGQNFYFLTKKFFFHNLTFFWIDWFYQICLFSHGTLELLQEYERKDYIVQNHWEFHGSINYVKIQRSSSSKKWKKIYIFKQNKNLDQKI